MECIFTIRRESTGAINAELPPEIKLKACAVVAGGKRSARYVERVDGGAGTRKSMHQLLVVISDLKDTQSAMIRHTTECWAQEAASCVLFSLIPRLKAAAASCSAMHLSSYMALYFVWSRYCIPDSLYCCRSSGG